MTDLGDRLDALAREATREVTFLPLDLAMRAVGDAYAESVPA